MSRLEELRNEYNEKYGPDWNRQLDLTEEEEIAWIEAFYDFFDEEGQLKEAYGGPYTDQYEEWYGHPFEIIESIAPYTDGYDLISLPLWHIRITDMEGDPKDPGIFAAYPEELFEDAEKQIVGE